jgi:hypothetical protein
VLVLVKNNINSKSAFLFIGNSYKHVYRRGQGTWDVKFPVLFGGKNGTFCLLWEIDEYIFILKL